MRAGCFVLLGSDTFDGNRFIPLDDALEQKCVVVHETGELEVENLSELFDLYIQAGDVVKGGRQDGTLGVDFVLPAKSGRVPIPSFCVESGRWHRRAGEDTDSFSSSKSYLASISLHMAAKLSKSQDEVWEKVAETQECLSASLDKPICAAASPTSYQLAVEDEDLQARKETYRADGELRSKPQATAKPVTTDTIQKWIIEAEKNAITDHQEVPPRVRVEPRRGEKTVVFDTLDHGFNDAVLHKNLVAN